MANVVRANRIDTTVHRTSGRMATAARPSAEIGAWKHPQLRMRGGDDDEVFKSPEMVPSFLSSPISAIEKRVVVPILRSVPFFYAETGNREHVVLQTFWIFLCFVICVTISNVPFFRPVLAGFAGHLLGGISYQATSLVGNFVSLLLLVLLLASFMKVIPVERRELVRLHRYGEDVASDRKETEKEKAERVEKEKEKLKKRRMDPPRTTLGGVRREMGGYGFRSVVGENQTTERTDSSVSSEKQAEVLPWKSPSRLSLARRCWNESELVSSEEEVQTLVSSSPVAASSYSLRQQVRPPVSYGVVVPTGDSSPSNAMAWERSSPLGQPAQASLGTSPATVSLPSSTSPSFSRYRSAPSMPTSRLTPTTVNESQASVGLDMLERWGLYDDAVVTRLRFWLAARCFAPLVHRIHRVDEAFAVARITTVAPLLSPGNDLSVKMVTPAPVRPTTPASSVFVSAPSMSFSTPLSSALPAPLVSNVPPELARERDEVEKYFRIDHFTSPSARRYVINRVVELADGRVLPAFRWNRGTDRVWDSSLPNDSLIVAHVFCTYMDSMMPSYPNTLQGRVFSSVYFARGANATVNEVAINLVEETPPRFRVIYADAAKKQNVWDVGDGRNTLFHSMILFLRFVQEHLHDHLGPVNLSGRAIDLMDIIHT